MSNFTKIGHRASLKEKKKIVRKHTKKFYKILNELDIVSKKIKEKYPKECESNFWNENNIEEAISEFSDLTIESMEKYVVLSKLYNLKENENK